MLATRPSVAFIPTGPSRLVQRVKYCASFSSEHQLVTLITSAALATAIMTSPINVQMNNYQYPQLAISSSAANAYLSENQQFISEVWAEVTSQYFDQSFNGLGLEGWKSVEQQALKAVQDTGPDDDDIVNDAVKEMLSKLNDPYTRFLPRQKYETLTSYAMGTALGGGGIGVQLLEDPRTKGVMVMSVSQNGPAAKAGLHTGDIIVKIDGENMESANADVVAAKCRGDIGEKIELDILRGDKATTQKISLVRTKITQNPVQATTFTIDSDKKIGLIKIPSFSTETVSQIVDGLRSVTSESNVDAIAIDLRGNVGGYMPAGVDAAKLFLPTRSKIISEVGKSGNAKTYEADGIGAQTSMPLYILVDKRTASASEIFAAALQDNKRAVIVGTSNSFGKGRIQNIKPLENGSGLAVTRARYLTPNGSDIHGIGISPDKRPSQCNDGDSVKTCLADVIGL